MNNDELKSFKQMIDWFFSNENNQSISLTIHRNLKEDKPERCYSIMSVDNDMQFNGIEKEYYYGHSLTEAMEGYAKQV